MKCRIDTVLIVDDEIEFANTVKRHLRREGVCADSAPDGRCACMKMMERDCRRLFFDLVITDVVMPGMDGITLLKWIQNIYPWTSVVVVSEFADLTLLRPQIRPELDAIGRKPLTPGAMMDMIGSIASKRHRWQATGARCRAPAGGRRG